MENKIKVFLADSQVLFREGMHFVLDCEEDVEVVGEGTSAEEVLAFLGKEAVDVLVLSEDMSDTARRIEEGFPSMRLIFTGNFHPSDERVGGGKSVFLSRDMDPRELVTAVRKAGRNNTSSRVPEPEKGNSDSLVSEQGEGMDATMKALRKRFLSLVESL